MGTEKNKRVVLTERQKRVILLLVQMSGKSLSTAVIAEKLKVSSRTILRDIFEIEKWMQENDFHFKRKPGVGLSIVEESENLELIKELLDIDKPESALSKEERRSNILGTLFFSKEPIKAYYFTSTNHISEGTLYEDLDILDRWLSAYNLSIIRKPGVGIYISGAESFIRQAITNALWETGTVDKNFGKTLELIEENPLLEFVNHSVLKYVGRLVKEVEKQQNIRYTDNGFITVIIRITVAVYRIQMGYSLKKEDLLSDESEDLKEYSIACDIAKSLKTEFGIVFNQFETGNLALYLATTRMWSRESMENDPLQDMNIRKVIISMASVVEHLTGIPFQQNANLMESLLFHIRSIVTRVSTNIIEDSSHTDEMKHSYPDMYEAVKVSCQVLQEWGFSKKISEADIGYITMHFVAAADEIKRKEQEIYIAVVCPNGIASSKMLVASLEKSFRNIKVRRVISAFSIDKDQLISEGIDLIISTIKIHIDFPHVVVGKVLQKQDKILIQNMLDSIEQNRQHRMTKNTISHNFSISLSDIERMAFIGTEIVELVQNMRIVPIHEVESMEHMINWASFLFARDMEGKRKIAEGFIEREKIADTYIPDMQIYLFHCMTDVVRHGRFGYLRLERPYRAEKGLVQGAVIMVVPKHNMNEDYLKPIGKLSALLVEDSGFLNSLKSGNIEVSAEIAEKALVKLYENMILNELENNNLN